MPPESKSLDSIFKEGNVNLLYLHPRTVELVLRYGHDIALFCRRESCFTERDYMGHMPIEKFLAFSF